MLKRIKKLWKIANKEEKEIEQLLSIPEKQLNNKSSYFFNGTDEEFKEFQNEQSGMSKWIKRLKDLV